MKNQKTAAVFFLLISLFLHTAAKDERPLEKGKVIAIDGRNIFLEDGRAVSLIATYVPRPGEPNFYPELKENLEKELLGKEIEFQIVRKAHTRGHYPELDRVVVVKDGYNLNLTLLQAGKAFFVEEYWNKWHRMDYEKAWRQAQIDKRGIWGSKQPPQPVYVRHWNYVTTYPAYCTDEISRIREKDRLYYYTVMPVTPYTPEWAQCGGPVPQETAPAPVPAAAPEAEPSLPAPVEPVREETAPVSAPQEPKDVPADEMDEPAVEETLPVEIVPAAEETFPVVTEEEISAPAETAPERKAPAEPLPVKALPQEAAPVEKAKPESVTPVVPQKTAAPVESGTDAAAEKKAAESPAAV